MSKRIFSIILSACLLVSGIPMQAFAEETILQVSSGDVQTALGEQQQQVSIGDIVVGVSEEEKEQIEAEIALMLSSVESGEGYELTEEQLCLLASEYLYNDAYDNIMRRCGDMAVDALSSVSDTDEVWASFMHGLKEGSSFLWNEIWASCGLSDSAYSEFETEAAKEVVLEYLNANDNLVKTSKKVGESFGVVEELYDLTTAGGKEDFAKKLKKNNLLLSEDEADEIADSLFENADTLMKYAGETEELFMLSVSLVEMQMIELQAIDDLIVVHNQIRDTTMRDALVQLRNEITTDIGTYFVTHYLKDKVLELIQDEVKTALIDLTVGESYFSDFSVALGKITVKIVAGIYEAVNPSVSDIVYAHLLYQYWINSDMAVAHYKYKFASGEGTAEDIRLLETAINFNAACTKMLLSKSKELVKNRNQGLYQRMECWESSMASEINYDMYLNSCLNNASKAIKAGTLVLEDDSATVKDSNGTVIDENYDSTETIKARFETIQSQFVPNVGQTWNEDWNGTIQCFGFARMVFYYLFDCNMPAQYVGGAKYQFATEDNVVLVGQLVGEEVSASTAQTLLQQGKLGDIIQASGSTYGQHTMVFVSADDTGVTVYDCNAHLDASEPDCVIHQWTINWNTWASWYGTGSANDVNGISLYRAGNYAKVYDDGEEMFYDDSVNFVIEDGVLVEYTGWQYVVDIPDTVTVIGDSAFKNNTSMRYVNIPEGVTSIGDYAFYGCTSLLGVVLPDSVTELGDLAFYNCTYLATATLSKSLQTMGDSAFRYCSSLTSIKIPKSLQTYSYGDYPSGAFRDCDNLIYVVFETGTSKIVNGLFANCESLTNVEIPDTVIVVGEEAFYECIKLEEVILPDSITEIQAYAFAFCNELESVTLPKSLKVIGRLAFMDCASLKSVIIPASLEECTTIEGLYGAVFASCNNLSQVTFDEGMTKIPNYLFAWCYGLKNIKIPDTVTSIGEEAFAYCINLESVTLSKSLETIGIKAFYGCRNLTSVEMSDTVMNIGEEAFYECANLVNIKLSKKLENIGKKAFGMCESLECVEIPKSLKSAGEDGDAVFEFCDNLSIVKFEEGTIKIQDYLFDMCNLTDIDIPDGVTIVGKGAFKNCGIMEIELPDSLTKIEEEAFCCTYLTSINIPDSVTTIGERAFDSCYYLSDVKLPKGLKTIGSGAFSFCNSLVSIEIPNSLECVEGDGKAVFELCDSLSNVIIEDGMTKIPNYLFASCYNLNGVEIPTSVKVIGEGAFRNCSTLKLISIPESVEKIEEKAFEGCSALVEIVIPEGLVSIGKRAFYECVNLENIVIPKSVTSIGINAFQNCSDLTIHGYLGSYAETYAKEINATFISLDKLIPAQNVTLNKSKLTINKGKTATLKATLTPSDSTDEITWKSSNTKVIKVSSKGVVTAVSKGSATITATSTSGMSAKCKVTVKEVASKKIKLNKTKVTINKGKTVTLKATLTPSNSTDTVSWKSSKNKVAKVSNKGVVTAVGKGTATITAKTTSGKTVKCQVTVKEIAAKKIKLNKTALTLKKGKTATLKAILTPKNSTDNVTWKSSNSKIAKVSNSGKVTAVKKGTATIIVKTTSGKTVKCKVTVK